MCFGVVTEDRELRRSVAVWLSWGAGPGAGRRLSISGAGFRRIPVYWAAVGELTVRAFAIHRSAVAGT